MATPTTKRPPPPPEPVPPLEDPDYQPLHPPVNGLIPDVVEKWGPRSQRRWFDRFNDQVRAQPYSVWERYYCSSTEHRGTCCSSCESDFWEGYGGDIDRCCCRAYRSEAAQ